ncbi:cupin domain-containing protein [Streptomyces sp. HK10]|uniref:cupin domain-containing protein n=1 Tax=Streptomyces sp. HK10 TaxID=3373255 RepID=UPI00374A1DD7
MTVQPTPSGRSVLLRFLPPDTDETGTSSRDADLDAAEVLTAVGRLPVNLAVFTVPAGAVTPPDSHHSHEMWLVQSGHGRVRCGDREHPVGPGALVALPGGEVHQLHADQEELTVVSLWWQP